jgi:hypothetical protein
MTQAYGQGQLAVARVRVDSRSGGVRLAHDQPPLPLASPRRSHALMEAIRRRFPGFPHSDTFHAWNANQARDDPDRFLTTRLFSDINRGHTPTPRHVSALAAAAGWTFEQVCLELGVDLARVPRLQAALGVDLTHVDVDRYAFSEGRELPSVVAPAAQLEVNAPLHDLVLDWMQAPADIWPPDERYVIGRIGRNDNIAFPRLPSGAAVLIDRTRTQPHDDGGFYAVEHPNGFSVARVATRGGLITLFSERSDFYPSLEYPLDQVLVHGRVAAVAGRIDRMKPPTAMHLSRLREEQRPILTPARTGEMSTSTLLRELVLRRSLTRSRFERKVRQLRRLAGRQFKLSRSHMSGLMQHDDLAPRLGTLYALSAILLLRPRDLLAAYGVQIAAPESDPPSPDQPSGARIARVQQHEAIKRLQQEGWDLPWLCSLLRPRGASMRAYYLGDPGTYLSPLITSQAFLIVNTRQRHVITRLYGRPVSELSDWMRPMYLLQTTTQRKYVCGYVDEEGDVLHVVPHTDGPTRRVLSLKTPEEAVVVGRVTHVATLLGA